jgi:hydrogenase maturation protein HypF
MSSAGHRRLRLQIEGLVQGVGFRPFVHRLATALELAGWVENTAAGVCLELEGSTAALEALLARLPRERPPHSRLDRLQQQWLPPQSSAGFRILTTAAQGAPGRPPAAATALQLPDLAPCAACLAELIDPASRRCGYAFTSCAHCGPRFSILRALPFERRHTALASFPLCAACASEYADPSNRRFHAQTSGCPACGPRLSWFTPGGPRLRDPARPSGPLSPCLAAAAAALRAGRIVALQSVGGFQLLCLAHSEAAVAELRRRKGRPEKPFALLAPDLAWVRRHCLLGPAEEQLLTGPAAPIVLLRRRPLEWVGPDPEAGASNPIASSIASSIATGVAPHNPWLGVMLAASPLHALLLRELGEPLLATSGNRCGEPLCADPERVEEELGAIADGILGHDRPIANPVDDGLIQLVAGAPMLLRHARGQAPSVLALTPLLPHPDRLAGVVAMGGQLKGSLAVGVAGGRAWLGPHLGDLDSLAAEQRLRQALSDALERFGLHPRCFVVDGHPAYASRRIGAELAAAAGVPLLEVQHHQAHLLACMAEHGLPPPAVGVAWDGAGHGGDGTLWGGECLRLEEPGGAAPFTRLARLRPFPLPGGERAMREPRRAALGLLYAGFGPAAFDGVPRLLPSLAAFGADERPVLARMLQQRLQSPLCSSVGRLFDAIASLLGLAQRCSFEGQAALRLEAAARAALPAVPGRLAPAAYTVAIRPGGHGEPWLLDWQPLLEALLHDLAADRPVEAIALAFHQALAQLLPALAGQLGVKRLLLAGGCFQNRLLLELAVECLADAGIEALWPQRIPCNDAGLALGQLLAAGWRLGPAADPAADPGEPCGEPG